MFRDVDRVASLVILVVPIDQGVPQVHAESSTAIEVYRNTIVLQRNRGGKTHYPAKAGQPGSTIVMAATPVVSSSEYTQPLRQHLDPHLADVVLVQAEELAVHMHRQRPGRAHHGLAAAAEADQRVVGREG